MCTALVYRNHGIGEFGIGFNRDESYLRKPALAPLSYTESGLSILAPRDGDFGGTWIGVNSSGEVLAILNYYEAPIRSIDRPISRGLLMKNLLEQKKNFFSITKESLNDYHPFRLLYINLMKTILLSWNGQEIKKEESKADYTIYASSAILGSQSEVIRSKSFEGYKNDQYFSDFFQLSSGFLSAHIPEKGVESPCMHRDIAHTVSQTIIKVHSGLARLWYKVGQPCESNQFLSYELKLS